MNKDETEEPKEGEYKEEEVKEGENKKEEIMKEYIIIQEPKKEVDKIEKEDSIDFSKTESQKAIKKEIYFIIFYSSDQKENPKDMTFCEECKIIPKIILSKEKKKR
jgi:hypothetical protein